MWHAVTATKYILVDTSLLNLTQFEVKGVHFRP